MNRYRRESVKFRILWSSIVRQMETAYRQVIDQAEGAR